MEQIHALRENGVTPGEQDAIDTLTGQILGAAYDVVLHPCDPSADDGCVVEIVPPDPRRCFLPKDEPNVTPPDSPCQTGSWIRQHFRTTGTPVGHGFANRPPEAERNNDGYYSFSPKPGIRFVALDTITDECGSEFCSEGSIDDTQFQWMRESDCGGRGAPPVRDLLRPPHAPHHPVREHGPDRAAAPLRAARRPPQPGQPAAPGRRRDARGAVLRVTRRAGATWPATSTRTMSSATTAPTTSLRRRTARCRPGAGTRTSGRSRRPPTSTGLSSPA